MNEKSLLNLNEFCNSKNKNSLSVLLILIGPPHCKV